MGLEGGGGACSEA